MSPRLLLNVAILFFRVNERPNFLALTAVAAAADRVPPAAAATGSTKQRRRRKRDAALIEVACLIPYSPAPNLTVTSFEQFIVPFSHTLYV